jgi:hypothetical protein
VVVCLHSVSTPQKKRKEKKKGAGHVVYSYNPRNRKIMVRDQLRQKLTRLSQKQASYGCTQCLCLQLLSRWHQEDLEFKTSLDKGSSETLSQKREKKSTLVRQAPCSLNYASSPFSLVILEIGSCFLPSLDSNPPILFPL